MYTSAVIDLRFESSWEPRRLTAQAFRWPGSTPLVALRDIASSLFPRSVADAGTPVVTPASLDSATGGIRRRSRKYQGSVYQVGSELRSGDVLVPRVGVGPAIMVSDYLRGSLISARFAALRSEEPHLCLWLWGLLSSDSGRRFRAGLAQATSVPTLDTRALLGATIPLPAIEKLRQASDMLRPLQEATRIEEEDAVETWWYTGDLRTTEWRIALATPDRSVLSGDEALVDYCDEIVAGRDTRRVGVDGELPGYLPVFDVSALGGKPPRRWVPVDEGNPVIGSPGDLLVARLGNLPHARVVDRPVVADQHVVVLRLRNPSLASPLAHYLNGQDAYRIRQVFLTGSTIPSLSLADLRRFPVSHAALSTAALPEQLRPLADALEQVLWGS